MYQKNNEKEYYLPKIIIWKLTQIFDTYIQALDYVKNIKIVVI